MTCVLCPVREVLEVAADVCECCETDLATTAYQFADGRVSVVCLECAEDLAAIDDAAAAEAVGNPTVDTGVDSDDA